MSLNETVLVATTLLAVATAIAAIVKDRRKPELDAAQAASALVNSDAVKAEIQRTSNALNAARDLRVLDLEKWADKMRPWVWEVRTTFDTMCALMREDRAALGLDMPDLHLSEPPEFPPPRP